MPGAPPHLYAKFICPMSSHFVYNLPAKVCFLENWSVDVNVLLVSHEVVPGIQVQRVHQVVLRVANKSLQNILDLKFIFVGFDPY